MALYITSAQFKGYAGIATSSTTHDATITASITAASRAIDGWCGRSFEAASSTSSRVFPARVPHRLEVTDFASATNVAVVTDEGDSGTYDTTWTITTDFTVGPPNALLNGLDWCRTEIRAVGSRFFPTSGQRNRVQVTAQWGWPATPDAVTQACYELALDIFKMKDSPFGVAGFNEYGVVRIRENKILQMLLAPYVKTALRL